MKLCSYYTLILVLFPIFFDVHAEFVAIPGTRIWDLVAELGYEANTILSKVDIIESIVENSTHCCSEVAVIDCNIDVITSIVENTTHCCSEVAIIDSTLDVVTSLLETNCCSEVAVIDCKINTIESILENTNFSSIDQAFVSIYGSQIADGRLDDISIQFQYGIPASTVQSYTQGGGTITTANSTALLTTAASATSIAQLQTKNAIGYRSGHEAYAYFTVSFTGSFTATSSQFIGPIDYQNGFAVGFDGTTFGVTRRVNTVNTFTPQSSFNGDKLNGTGASGFTYNPALLNVFRIGYGYLGSSVIKFQIMNSNGTWITFHTIQYPNSAATPSINQPFLPITARVENIAGTSVLSMSTVSWNAGIVGSPNSCSYRYFEVDNAVTPTVTNTEVHVLTIQNKLVFNNQPNVIRVRCTGICNAAQNTATFADFRLRKNATVTGTSYSDVDTTNSVIQVSKVGTYTTGTGTSVLWQPFQLSNLLQLAVFIPDTYNIYLLPGDSLTLTAATTAIAVNNQAVGSILWEEQF